MSQADSHPDRARRRADGLFSDVLLPAETLGIRQQVRDFARRELAPRAYALNTTPEDRSTFPREVLAAMAAEGVLGIPFPSDVGGRGLRFPTLAVMTLLEEVAYYSAGVASALIDAQLLLVGQTLERAGGPLRERWLPPLLRGEIVAAFATSEPQASTDLSPGAMLTTADRAEGGWRINGRKRWITNAVAADIILVLCRSGTHQNFLLVETRDNGVTVGDPDLKMGNHPQLTSDVVFEDAFAPDSHLIGAEGSGLRAALSALMLGRIGIGAVGVGLAQAAFDLACEHLETRKVFGQELARFQHWQFTFADHAIALEAARSLYQKAAYRFDVEGAADTEAAMAKTAGSRLAGDVARDAIQVCGASGFARRIRATNEPRELEAIYRDAKIGEIYEGANEIQKWIVARRIFGRDLVG
jgi:butyryl-CoA dehydrogenase